MSIGEGVRKCRLEEVMKMGAGGEKMQVRVALRYHASWPTYQHLCDQQPVGSP